MASFLNEQITAHLLSSIEYICQSLSWKEWNKQEAQWTDIGQAAEQHKCHNYIMIRTCFRFADVLQARKLELRLVGLGPSAASNWSAVSWWLGSWERTFIPLFMVETKEFEKRVGRIFSSILGKRVSFYFTVPPKDDICELWSWSRVYPDSPKPQTLRQRQWSVIGPVCQTREEMWKCFWDIPVRSLCSLCHEHTHFQSISILCERHIQHRVASYPLNTVMDFNDIPCWSLSLTISTTNTTVFPRNQDHSTQTYTKWPCTTARIRFS